MARAQDDTTEHGWVGGVVRTKISELLSSTQKMNGFIGFETFIGQIWRLEAPNSCGFHADDIDQQDFESTHRHLSRDERP
jgi:hypothetical protein